MKWIGQHIWDFISRFRSDVYLEATESGTIASGGNLGLDSNNKIVKATGVSSSTLASTVTVTDSTANTYFPIVFHNESNGLLDDTGAFKYNPSLADLALVASGNGSFSLYETADTANDIHVNFYNTKGGAAGDDNDNLGTFSFYGKNDAGSPQTIQYGSFTTLIADASDSDEAGKIAITVATEGVERQGLTVTGDGASSKVDVDLGYSAASTTTIAGTLTMGSTAFVNNSGVVQVATQGTIDHDSLANFVTAEHVDWAGASAGTIHSSNIPILNQSTTGQAGTVVTIDGLAPNTATTQAAQGNITSLGTLTALDVDNINLNLNTVSSTALNLTLKSAVDLNLVAIGNDINADTDNFTIESSGTLKPSFTLKATSSGNKPSEFNFAKDKGAAGADSDYIGFVNFISDNDAQEQVQFANITAQVRLAADGAEEGRFAISIKNTDHINNPRESFALVANGAATDATIGYGLTSTTTVSGNLTARETTVTNLITSGNIELGHATDTTITRSAAGKVAIQGNEIQTKNVHHHFLNAGFFLNYPYSRYIPLQGSLNEQNTATASPEYVNFTWPYDGYVKTMWLRSETDMGNTELALYKGASGATVVTALGAVTESVSASNAVEFDFTSVTNTYSQGDTMAVRIDPTDDPDGGQNITIELIFDLTT